MKVFGELSLKGSPQSLSKALDDIEAHLSDGWSRSTQLEDQVKRADARCYACDALESRPAAGLWLFQKSDQELYVSNIVPTSADAISIPDYNLILDEFRTKFARPAADRFGLDIVTGKTEQDLEDWMSPKAAAALRRFSQLANRQTGSGHPNDRERWYEAISQLYRDKKWPGSSVIREWLTQQERWSDQIASDLAHEYEFGLNLLKEYDPL